MAKHVLMRMRLLPKRGHAHTQVLALFTSVFGVSRGVL